MLKKLKGLKRVKEVKKIKCFFAFLDSLYNRLKALILFKIAVCTYVVILH